MKRTICAFVLMAVAAATCVAEKTSIHGLGLSVPFESQAWLNADVSKSETFSCIGINLDYWNMSMHGDSFVGFSGIYDMQLGFFSGKTAYQEYNWFDPMSIKGGWGVAFRPTEAIILATHGTLGLDCKVLWDGDDNPPCPDITMRTGSDVVFVYKLGEHFGISAGIDGYIPLIGFGLDKVKIPDPSFSKGYKEPYEPYIIAGGIGCNMTFSLCWVF